MFLETSEFVIPLIKYAQVNLFKVRDTVKSEFFEFNLNDTAFLETPAPILFPSDWTFDCP